MQAAACCLLSCLKLAGGIPFTYSRTVLPYMLERLTWGSGSWLRLEVTGGSEATQVGTGKLWGSELMHSAFNEGISVPSALRCRCTVCVHTVSTFAGAVVKTIYDREPPSASDAPLSLHTARNGWMLTS